MVHTTTPRIRSRPQTPLHLQSALILTFIGCCTACTSAGRYFFFSETSIARLMRRSLPVATIQQRQPEQAQQCSPTLTNLGCT